MASDRERLAVLYDADCEICRMTVRALRMLDWRGRLGFSPLQRFEASGSADPSRRALLKALHVRDGSGRWQRGGEAMLRIASLLPLLHPLAVVGRLPGMAPVVEAAYRLVADNRHRIARVLDGAAGALRRVSRSPGAR